MQLDLTTPGGVTLALVPELMLAAWILVLMLVAAWRHQEAADQRRIGVLAALTLDRSRLKNLSAWATCAVSAGFISGVSMPM